MLVMMQVNFRIKMLSNFDVMLNIIRLSKRQILRAETAFIGRSHIPMFCGKIGQKKGQFIFSKFLSSETTDYVKLMT